jgi:anti-anti-sigma factor
MVDIEVVQRSDGDVHVRVAGEVDISSRRPLAEALRRAVDDQDGAVVIDLSAVRFFSAAGVDCVDAAVTELGARGRPVRVVCPDPGPVWRLICVLRLSSTGRSITASRTRSPASTFPRSPVRTAADHGRPHAGPLSLVLPPPL